MNLQIFPTQEEQIDAIIASLTQTVNKLLKTQPTVTIAFSGGKSPIPMFEKLSLANVDFSKIIFTLVDERIVDTKHVDSNENLVRTHLLKNNAHLAKFIGLNDTLTHDELVNQANRTITNIDIAILGMGEDGHTASIFPECEEIQDALDLTYPHNYILTTPLSAKYKRIGLSLSALVNIPHLMVSIANNTKLNVIKEAILGDNLNYPISYVLARKPSTQIFWTE